MDAELRETVLGKDHPDTLATLMGLAISLHSQGTIQRRAEAGFDSYCI